MRQWVRACKLHVCDVVLPTTVMEGVLSYCSFLTPDMFLCTVTRGNTAVPLGNLPVKALFVKGADFISYTAIAMAQHVPDRGTRSQPTCFQDSGPDWLRAITRWLSIKSSSSLIIGLKGSICQCLAL